MIERSKDKNNEVENNESKKIFTFFDFSLLIIDTVAQEM